MSTKYGPVGKEVACEPLRVRRSRDYNPFSSKLGDLLEGTIERIDDMMTESRSGCSFETDDDGRQYHRYDRRFKTSLYSGGETRQTTWLSLLRIASNRPKNYTTERYFITLEQGTKEVGSLVNTSYIFTRFIQSRVSAQVQYSVDLPDWITHPDGGPEALWHEAAAYDIKQLNAELIGLERVQHYEDEVAAWDQARGFSSLKLNA